MIAASYSLRIRTPGDTPVELVERLRSALPQFKVSASRDWVEVAGGDFMTIRDRVGSVLEDWDAKGIAWRDRLVRL